MRGKYRWYRKLNNKQRILWLRQQYMTITETYDIYLRRCPPSFCNFCKNYWYDQGLEDADFGCHANSKRFDELDGDVTCCGQFKANGGDVELACQQALNDMLWKAIERINPENQSIATMLERKAKLDEEIREAKKELKQLQTAQESELEYHKTKLEKLVPAEVFARISA